jgi:hypothetical protein
VTTYPTPDDRRLKLIVFSIVEKARNPKSASPKKTKNDEPIIRNKHDQFESHSTTKYQFLATDTYRYQRAPCMLLFFFSEFVFNIISELSSVTSILAFARELWADS